MTADVVGSFSDDQITVTVANADADSASNIAVSAGGSSVSTSSTSGTNDQLVATFQSSETFNDGDTVQITADNVNNPSSSPQDVTVATTGKGDNTQVVGTDALALGQNPSFESATALVRDFEGDAVGADDVTVTFDGSGDFSGDYTVSANGASNTVTVSDGDQSDSVVSFDSGVDIEAGDTVEVTYNGAGDGNAFTDQTADVKSITLSTNRVTLGETLTYTVDIQGFGDEDVNYYVTGPVESGESYTDAGVRGDVTSGSTSDSSVQVRQSFPFRGDFVVEVEGQSSGDQVTANILSAYDANVNVTPSDATFGDSLTVEGSVTNAAGDGISGVNLRVVNAVEDTAFENNQPSPTTTATTSTANDGTFLVQFDADDAGEYVIEESSGDQEGTEYANVTTAPQDATVSITPDGNNLANFEETYNVSATTTDGESLDFSTVATQENYINVTGPFDESSAGSISVDTGTLLRVGATEDVDGDGDQDALYVHVQPDTGTQSAYNSVIFDATPVDPSVNLTATLENDLSNDLVDEDAEDAAYVGIEDGTVPTPATPDYVGSDSATIGVAQALNVQYEVTSGSEFDVDTDPNTLDVTIQGSDSLPPDGTSGQNSNALDSVDISVTGPGVDAEQPDLTEGSGLTGGTATFGSLTFQQGGQATVNVTATTDAGDTFTDTETFTVTGDQLVSASPSTVTVDQTTDFDFTIQNSQGTPVNNRVVTLSSDGNTVDFEVTDTSGNSQTVNTIVIDAGAGTVTNGAGITIDDSFIANNGQYTVENVGFGSTGDVDVTVANPGGDTTINAEDAIAVQGVTAYNVSANVDSLLLTDTETVLFTVTQDGSNVTGTDLSALNFNAVQGPTDTDVTESGVSYVDADGDGTNDGIEVDINADVSEDPVNVSVDDGSGQRGDLAVDTVAPTISANASSLTEIVTSNNVGFTVTDPRDGSAVETDVQIDVTAENITVDVTDPSGTGDGTFSIETFVGSTATASVTGGDADGVVNLGAVTTNLTAKNYAPSQVVVSAEVDDGTADSAFGELVVPVEDISTDAPDTLQPNQQTTVGLFVQDGEGLGIGNRGVGLDGAGVDVDGTTDADGLASFSVTPSSGTIDVQVTSDTNATLTAVDTIEVRNQVSLTLTADATTVQRNDSVTFTIQRDDAPNVNPSGTLTIADAANGTVLNRVDVSQGSATVTFNSAGEFEVTASKESTGGNSFVNDSVTVTVESEDQPPVVGDDPAQDLDGDGNFEDVNGNGAFTLADVTFLFENQNADAVQNNPDAFDFNDNGDFTLADITFLFQEA